ncbi:hypothetical protein WA845_02945 [Agrobacterium sp. CMT1]|uniref:hypothetical protein n=1 Tax=Agrobacterium sp. CMT1 TaxID=3128901 RepID=UPI0030770493
MTKPCNDPVVTLRLLGQVTRYLASGQKLPYHLEIFLIQGLTPFVETAGEVSLDQSFGTRRHGGITTSNAARNARRDDMLRRLRDQHIEWCDLPASVASRRMRRSFETYEAGRWKRDRNAIAAPSTEPAATFWRVLNSGTRMPQTDRLRQILEQGIQEGL